MMWPLMYRGILFLSFCPLSSLFNCPPLSLVTCFLYALSLSLFFCFFSILLPSCRLVWGFLSRGWKMLDQRSALSYRSTGDTPTNSHAYPPPTSHTCTHKELFVFLLSHVNKFCVCPDHVAVCGLMKLTAETEKTDGPGRRQALHNMFTVCFIVLLSIHHITRHRHLNAGQICCQRNSSWSQLNIQIQLYYKLF